MNSEKSRELAGVRRWGKKTGRHAASFVVLMAWTAFIATASGPSPAATIEKLKDINPSGYSAISNIGPTTWNGAVYFPANDGVHGVELWRTDGTAAGTAMVKDINPSGDMLPFTMAWTVGAPRFEAYNGSLYFSADDGVHGLELWRTDGTAAGTVMVKDINPAGGSRPFGMKVMAGTLFFFAGDGSNGFELWKSNGTMAGTSMVKAITPSTPYGSQRPLHEFQNKVFFLRDYGSSSLELWKSDGTATGTVLVKEISVASAGGTWIVGAFRDALYLTVEEPVYGKVLWKSDGSAAGTGRVEPMPALYDFVVLNDQMFGEGNHGSLGVELLRSDGTASGTSLVKDINPLGDSDPYINIVANGTIFMDADDGVHGHQLWKSDGTTAGTKLVKIINPTGIPVLPYVLDSGFVSMRNLIFFRPDDGTHGSELWQSDGTESGTFLVADINPSGNSIPRYFAPLGDSLIFWATDGTGDAEPWIYRPDFAPAVESITRIGSLWTDASTVQFRVTFSDDVSGVDSSDFAIIQSEGITDAHVASVEGTGTIYTVTVADIAGQGVLRLNVVDDDSITSVSHVPLGGSGLSNGGFQNGQAFQIVSQLPLASWPGVVVLLLCGVLILRMERPFLRD